MHGLYICSLCWYLMFRYEDLVRLESFRHQPSPPNFVYTLTSYRYALELYWTFFKLPFSLHRGRWLLYQRKALKAWCCILPRQKRAHCENPFRRNSALSGWCMVFPAQKVLTAVEYLLVIHLPQDTRNKNYTFQI